MFKKERNQCFWVGARAWLSSTTRLLTGHGEARTCLGGALARLEAPCSEFTCESQVILYNGMSPGGQNQQRFKTMSLLILNECMAAGVLRS